MRTSNILPNAEQQLVVAITALRNGDFTTRLPDDSSDVAPVFNALAQMLTELDSEIRRVSREIGTEGRFGPQALVPDTQGDWSVLVSEFNGMAANLTNQIRNIAKITETIASGNVGPKVTVDAQGEMLRLKEVINGYVDTLNNS